VVRVILPVILALTLLSCRSTRVVERVKIEYDSTAIRNEAKLQEELRETTARYEKMLESASGTEVVFETRTDTVTLPGRIEYYPDGRLKSVEGQLASVRQSLQESEAQRYEYSDSIATLKSELEQAKTEVKERVQVVEKKVEYVPMWAWALLLTMAAVTLRAYLPKLIDFFKPKYRI
jgi:chromosome segregation ATPase